MSINIVLLGPDDIVVASDGLVVDKHGTVVRTRARKSCRLNNRLCFVSGGASVHAKVMLSQMDGRCTALNSLCPEDDWEERKWTLPLDRASAHSEMAKGYVALAAEVARIDAMPLDSAFFLCGWEDRAAVVSYYAMKPNRDGEMVPDIRQVSSLGKMRHFINGIPAAHRAFAETDMRLEALRDLQDAERVLVDCIRSAATCNSDLKANAHVLTRRLSDKFRPIWHDPTSSSEAPTPST